MRALIALSLLVVAACRSPSPEAQGPTGQAPPPESEPPVALNADMPIAYPPALFEQKVEGDVTLRLFVDSTGKLIAESTRVAEPSAYPALDSAALAGAAALRFAPAKRHGVPVATAFLQPVEFRQVGTTRTGTVTLPPGPPPTAAPPPAPVPARAPPPAPPQPRPRPPAPPTPVRPVPDTTRADTTKARRDTTPTDTTRARPDTSGSAH